VDLLCDCVLYVLQTRVFAGLAVDKVRLTTVNLRYVGKILSVTSLFHSVKGTLCMPLVGFMLLWVQIGLCITTCICPAFYAVILVINIYRRP